MVATLPTSAAGPRCSAACSRSTLTRNTGAAFSIGTSMTIVFTVIAVGVVIYILRTARQPAQPRLGHHARPAARRGHWAT